MTQSGVRAAPTRRADSRRIELLLDREVSSLIPASGSERERYEHWCGAEETYARPQFTIDVEVHREQ
jgi:hypothetical protein